MHDLPRSAVLFLSTGRPGERNDGQRDYATFSQLRVSQRCALTFIWEVLYNTSELLMSVFSRVEGLSDNRPSGFEEAGCRMSIVVRLGGYDGAVRRRYLGSEVCLVQRS